VTLVFDVKEFLSLFSNEIGLQINCCSRTM